MLLGRCLVLRSALAMRAAMMPWHARPVARTLSTRGAVVGGATSDTTADDGSTRPWSTYAVLHEDDALLVVDKGHGLLTVPGIGPTKRDCLVARLRTARGDGEDLMACHRLDRDTSGLVVLAKTKQALRQVSMAFESRTVQKTYVAAILGAPAESTGFVDAPIATFDTAPRMRIHDDGRPSQTRWKVLKRRRRGEDEIALLELEPLTGRQHQLRVHLAHLGFPVLGDTLHGKSSVCLAHIMVTLSGTPAAAAAYPRLALHAAKLVFPHPVTGDKNVTYVSEHPF